MARWHWRLTDRVTGYTYCEADAMLPVVPIEPGDRRPYLLGRQHTTWTLGAALRKGYDGLFVLNRHRRDDLGRPMWTRAIEREWGRADELAEQAAIDDLEDALPEDDELDHLVCDDAPESWQEPVHVSEVVRDLMDELMKPRKPAAGDR